MRPTKVTVVATLHKMQKGRNKMAMAAALARGLDADKQKKIQQQKERIRQINARRKKLWKVAESDFKAEMWGYRCKLGVH